MASIHKERRNGKTYYRLQFYDKDNRRRSMRLGAINKKSADAIRAKVEDLVSSSISGGSPHNETARWLTTIGDDLVAKLTYAGFGMFIPTRESATLKAFWDAYVESRKADTSSGTIDNFRQTQRELVSYFGAERDLRKISEGDADDWRQSLTPKFAPATVSKLVKQARQVFKYAVRKGVADRNAFAEVKAGSQQNDARKCFIERGTIEKVIQACPDAEWRLIVSLARYGGLRTPSETLKLRWGDIDWDKRRITVTSPKTKKQGKPFRVMPLFSKLEIPLAEAFEQAPEGAEFVISRYRDPRSNLRTPFCRILERAGVAPWERLFQNLRASCETELVDKFPIHVVTQWLGNTPAVANKHYLQVTDAHFAQAVDKTGGATGGAIAAEVVQQSVLSASDTDCQELTEAQTASEVNTPSAMFSDAFATLPSCPARTRT